MLCRTCSEEILYLQIFVKEVLADFNSGTVRWIVTVFLICFIFVIHTIGNSLTLNFTS